VDVVREKLEDFDKVYVVGECNRENPLKVAQVLARCIRVICRERPDVVISSGAAVGCIACFLGKLVGARIVWIDSITNIRTLSLSGRLVRRVADLFLVQWPELAEQYASAEYVGAVI
jgi:UDP-N-acetylglucosamine:LPS N-acetylglucosamine transferase